MRSSWRLGRWRGAPISLHWTVLIAIPWFYYETRTLVDTVAAFVAFFFLILIHELGHAAVARWRGVEVESIRLFFIHGTCSTEEPDYELDDTADLVQAPEGISAKSLLPILRQRVTH